MRTLLVLLAAASLAGCSSGSEAPNTSEVDINDAASDAQNSIASYAAEQQHEGEPARGEATAAPASSPAGNDAVPEPLNPPAPGQPGGLPDDRTPIAETPATPDSAQGAATVVETYYGLLGAKRYAEAWRLWDRRGQASGTSAVDFAASFAEFSEYHANVGAPGPIDAGAGQRYVTVPVQVYGRRRADGKPFYRLGQVTLHRAGDIDGATAEQRRWHINTIDLKPVSAAR